MQKNKSCFGVHQSLANLHLFLSPFLVLALALVTGCSGDNSAGEDEGDEASNKVQPSDEARLSCYQALFAKYPQVAVRFSDIERADVILLDSRSYADFGDSATEVAKCRE